MTIPPLRMSWVVYALAIGLSVGYLKGCTDADLRHAEFKGAVTAIGKAQEARTRDRIALDKKRKETANAENLKLRTDYAAVSKRLRIERAGRNILPARTAPTGSPAAVTFNWDRLDRALRDLDAGVREIVGEGDEARIDLDTARRWAQPQE